MKTKVFFPAALIVALMIAQTCVAQEEVRYIKTGKMFLQGNIGYGGGAFIAVGASFPLVPQVNFQVYPR
ncbi:MAG: hypothetical protein RML35_07280 [Chloroherpetonaceae bacterium]|nr:hypothetical protein [Chloroherpetonaceae bacterium]